MFQHSRMFNIICIIIALKLLQLKQASAYFYCGEERMKELCRERTHFMCNKEEISMGGTYLAHVPITTKLRNIIIDEHNEYRNKVASGEEKGKDGTTAYPKAARMRELIWDNELAYMANEHAARCHMQHDKCHNTVNFLFTGQNLAYMGSSQALKVIDSIKQMIKNWYDEKDLVDDPENCAHEYDAAKLQGAGHFTGMIGDRISRVGCALAYCTECPSMEHCFFFTCNYDMTNMLGEMIYLTDDNQAATKCSNWESTQSSKYAHLCTNTGKIFPTH